MTSDSLEIQSMNEVSTIRLYLIRALFLLIALGMGSIIWPLMLRHHEWPVMHSVANSMLAALTALSLLGVRYPLQMLPLLIFEFAWKTIWIVAIAIPIWMAGRMNPETMETVVACMMGVILCPLVIPWGYVWRNYVKKPADRWTPASN